MKFMFWQEKFKHKNSSLPFGLPSPSNLSFRDSSDGKRIHQQCRRPQFDPWVGKIHWRRGRLPTPVFLGFPCGSAGKESACNVGDLDLIPGLGRCPGEGKGTPVFWPGEFHGLHSPCGEGNGNPLQYSCLENPMDGGAWWAAVHRVPKRWQGPLPSGAGGSDRRSR